MKFRIIASGLVIVVVAVLAIVMDDQAKTGGQQPATLDDSALRSLSTN